MRANLSQIETFYWVARLGSFHGAAKHLHLTQPTISARIKELEQALGSKLFDRSRQRTRLTPEGDAALHHAERILSIAEEMRSTVTAQDPLRGLLRLGAVESVALLCLPDLLSAIGSLAPDLKVETTVDIGTELNRKLNERELELAFLTDPEPGSHVHVEPLGLVDMQWIGSPRLPLGRRTLRPADLHRLPIMTHPRPATMNTMVDSWFKDAGLEPQHLSTCNSMTVMARFAAAGHGVTILPQAILRSDIRTGRLRVLPTRPRLKPRTLSACFQADKRHTTMRSIIDAAGKIMRRHRLIRSAADA